MAFHQGEKKRRKLNGGSPSDDMDNCDQSFTFDDDHISPMDFVKVEDDSDNCKDENACATLKIPNFTLIPTSLPDVPYQPDSVPPYRDRRRPHLFQKKWYKEYPWLHFDLQSESMFCFQCLSAVLEKVVECPSVNIFARGGFRNWKKGPERFRSHENSQLHLDTSQFSAAKFIGLNEKYIVVEHIISSIQYLLQIGYDPNQQQLLKLLHLRKSDVPVLTELLTKSTFSHSDERELLRIMTSATMKTLSAKVKSFGFYGLTLDKVNVNGATMFAASARFSSNLKTEEFYLGMFKETNIQGIFNYLDKRKMNSYCCDMGESLSISTTLDTANPTVKRLRPRNIYIDLQDMLKTTDMRYTLMLIEELKKIVKSVDLSTNDNPDNQHSLGHNRNPITIKTISAILTNYTDIIRELEQLKNHQLVISFVLQELKKRNTFFNLLVCKVLLYPVENLNTLLISVESIKDAVESATSLVNVFNSYKEDDDEFESFWRKYTLTCKLHNVWSEPIDTIAMMKPSQHQTYISTIETILEYLKNAIGEKYGDLIYLETALVTREEKCFKETEQALKSNKINPENLSIEKTILSKMLGEDASAIWTFSKIVSKLREMNSSILGLIPEMVKLIDLLLVAQIGDSQPIKKLKTFFKLNRSFDLINELSILYFYRDDHFMNSKLVAKEYIESDQQRMANLFR